MKVKQRGDLHVIKRLLFRFRSANLNEMVSSIIDENSEYHQNGMMPTFSQYPSMMMPTAWSNGEQQDQHMHYMQQVKQ